MEITVWSVAVDDDNGTYASVYETELAAYRRLIELTVDSDDEDQRAKAEAFIEAGDFDGLDQWIHEQVIESPVLIALHAISDCPSAAPAWPASPVPRATPSSDPDSARTASR